MGLLSAFRIAFIVMVSVFVLISMLIGLKRGLVKSVNRLVMLLVAVLLSVLTCNIIINCFGSQISNVILTNLNDMGAIAQMEELFTASPTLEQYLPTLAMCLVAPVVFFVLFIVYAVLTLIIGAIINIFLKNLRQRENGTIPRVLGMAISAVCGLIIVVSLLTPFAGYAINVSNVYTRIESEGLIETTEDPSAKKLGEDIKGFKNEFIINFVYTLSSPMFKGVTNYRNADGKTQNVVDDVNSMLEFIPPVMNLSEMDFADIKNLDLTPLKQIVGGIGDNAQMRAIVAEILSYASGKWLNNEQFMGLNIKEQLPQDLKSALDPALLKLNKTTKDTVEADLNEFISEIELLKEVYPAAEEISKMDFSDVKSINTVPFLTIANTIGDTKIVKEIVVNVMRDAGNRWLQSQAFMDINIEAMLPADLQNCLMPAYERFANTSKDSIVEDLYDFVSVLDSVKNVYADFEKISALDFSSSTAFMNIDTKCFYDLADHASSTTLGNKVLANVLSRAGDRWVNGQMFMDINIDDKLPEDLKGSLNPIFELLSNSTENTLKADLTEFAYLIDDMKVIYSNIDGFTNNNFDIGSLKTLDVSSIRAISKAVKEAKSSVTDDVTANIFVRLGTNWKAQQPFMNVNLEVSLHEDLKNVFTPSYEMFEQTTPQTVADDIDKFATLFEDVRNIFLDIDEIHSLTISSVADIETMNTASLHKMAEHSSNCQPLSKQVIANVISRAGTNWGASLVYLSININEMLPADLTGMLNPAFTLLASSNVDTVSGNLEDFALLFDDLKVIFGNLNDITTQKFDAQNIDNLNVAPIRAMAASVDSATSSLTAETVAIVLNKAGTNWLDSKEFLGLNIKEQLPDGFKDSLDTSLTALKNSTKQTASNSLNAFADEVEEYVAAYKRLHELLPPQV